MPFTYRFEPSSRRGEREREGERGERGGEGEERGGEREREGERGDGEKGDRRETHVSTVIRRGDERRSALRGANSRKKKEVW